MITDTPTLADAALAFREFCASVGLDPGHNPEPTHGKVRRFDVIDTDGRTKKLRGWYIFHADSRPVGVVCDHGVGIKHTWKFEGETRRYTPEEWAAERREMRAAQKLRHQEQLEKYAAATRKAVASLELSSDPDHAHPYLVKKRVRPHNARSLNRNLIIPVYGIDGAVMSSQTIRPDGSKQFYPGAPVKMGFCALGRDPDAAHLIIVCEGWATGATLSEALPEAAVIVAFNSGNLPGIAEHFAAKYGKRARLVIAADNDRKTERERGFNPGIDAATKACRATGADMAVPVLSDPSHSDFNDMPDPDQVRSIVLSARPIAAKIDPDLEPKFEAAPIDYNDYVDVNPDDYVFDPDYSPEYAPEPVEPYDPVAALMSAPVTDWRVQLLYDKKNELNARDCGNMRLFMTYHDDMIGVFKKDLFAEQIIVTNAPWSPSRTPRILQDDDIDHAREWLQRHGLKPSGAEAGAAIRLAAAANAFDPICDYLDGLTWDQKPRLDAMLTYYFGAIPTNLTPIVSAKFMISAVARAMRPGCKVDTMLILEGPQGAKKSSGIAALFGEEFTRLSTNLFDSTKLAVETMTGAWCVEVAEMAALLKQASANEKIKAIISTQVDTVRLSYARVTGQYKRRSILIGTINPGDNGYLSDMTGNRRYWPVTVENVSLEAINRDRDQLWAEAVARYKANEPWWLDDDEMIFTAQREAAERVETHPWEECLLGNQDFTANEWVTVSNAFEALGILPKDRTPFAQKTVAACLRRLGYTRRDKKLSGRAVKVWERGV